MSADRKSNALLQSALDLASRGYRIIPLHNITGDNECSCQAWLRENGSNRECPTPGKHPRFREFAAKATIDGQQIRQWWAKWPKANVGIIAGKESGIWALDTDPRNNGDLSRDSLVYKIGQLPYTMTARTGGGGTHEYFRWPPDFDLPAAMSLGEEYPGIDIVGEGHVLVAPPSYHFSGRAYAWEPELSPDEQLPVDAPAALLAMLKARIDAQAATSTSGAKPVGNFPLADVGKILRGCAWMQHCAEDASRLGEPEWYAQLSILGRCENGDALAHDLSSPHPGYNASATAAKLRHAVNDTGPVTCGRVRHSLGGGKYCDSCSNAGQVKSPVVLGMRAERIEPTPWPEGMSDSRPEEPVGTAEPRSAEEGMELRATPVSIDIRARVEKVIADDDVSAVYHLAGHLAAVELDVLAELKHKLREHFGDRLKMRDLDAAIKEKRSKLKPGGRASSGVPDGGSALAERWEDRWESRLLRTNTGAPCANLANAMIALRHAPEWKDMLWRDDFAEWTITRAQPPIPAPPGKWTNLHDILTTNWMQEHGIDVPLQITGLAVEAVAHDQHCHPPREYISALKWDGEFRLSKWLVTYLGGVASEPVPDCFTLNADGERVPVTGPDGKPRQATPYIEAVGEKWLISAIARIFDPGCKADCALVLEGEQGLKKSSALKVIGGEWFTDELDAFGSKDSKMQTHGKWIIEIGELASISKSEVEDVKSFMSRQEERYRPPYAGRLTEVPRQCIFAGTANNSNYLKDDSGNRRFWPVFCQRIDLEALRRDRDQLLAEAKFRYDEGATWWLDVPEVRAQAEGEQSARFLEDPWDERIKHYLRWELPEDGKETTIAKVMQVSLGIEIARQTRADGGRVASILRVNGWHKVRKGSRKEEREYVYRPKAEASRLANAKQFSLVGVPTRDFPDEDVPQ